MTPATIIREAQSEGVKLALSPTGNIKATGNGAAVNRWLSVIRDHKAKIIEALKIGDGDPATIGETLDQCRQDPEALAYFIGLATGLQKMERNATSCKTCQHFKRPGLSPGYCGGRDDLPLAYGANHPLRKLPSDGGTNCDQWQDSS